MREKKDKKHKQHFSRRLPKNAPNFSIPRILRQIVEKVSKESSHECVVFEVPRMIDRFNEDPVDFYNFFLSPLCTIQVCHRKSNFWSFL